MGTKEESCGRTDTDVERCGQRNRSGEGLTLLGRNKLGLRVTVMGCNLGGGLKSHGIGYGPFYTTA